jgi:phage N-6-adenine-methyltransferase
MSKRADVVQGRLGWEAGDISQAAVSELEAHPKNREIYGDTGDLEESFVESIREKGVLEPLVITGDKQVISGHRRLQAAREVGIDAVPVRISEFDTDLAEREALIEFNRQREKTPGQIVNEFEEMLEVEKQRAKKRKDDAGGHVENLPQGDSGKARDKAAEKVNADVSGRTLEKGKNVKDKAESDDEPDEVQEAAQEAWNGLQSGEESFSSAHQKVKDAENDSEDKDDEHTVVDAATKQETDEWSSPRELVEPLNDAIGGFDLDPCSGAEQSPFAADTYTEADDGLAQEWFGDVWVNPPYSEMADWTEKAAAEVKRGNADSVVYLCKGDSSTGWWQSGAEQTAAICAIDHRLKFGDGENSAPFASHIFVFGDIDDAVRDELTNHGLLLEVQV